MKCKYAGRNEPRIVPGEHFDGCPGDCDGCWPCPARHCAVDGHRHVDNPHPATCPESAEGDVRTTRAVYYALRATSGLGEAEEGE